MPSPRIAVIVPVRDDALRLRTCLTALARQTLADREVVVVDNGSRDDVAGVVAVFPGVRLVREPQRGSYRARNRGLAATSAPLIAFTDADCVPQPDWLERGVELLDARPDVSVVAGDVDVFPARAGRPNAVEAYEQLTAFPQRHFVARWSFGATANVFTRRSVVEQVGAFDPLLQSGGDAEWGERVAAAGHRVVHSPAPVVRHPARRTVAELRAKFTRITRGIEQLWTSRGEVPPVIGVAAERLSEPWRALPSVLCDDRLPRPWDRLRFFAVSLLVSLITASEAVRARSATLSHAGVQERRQAA